MADNAKRLTYAEFKEELLQDPEVRRGYEAAQPQFQLACQRIEAGLTQKQLAELAGTTQAAISGLLAGKRNVRLDTFQRVARALGLRIELVPISDEGEG